MIEKTTLNSVKLFLILISLSAHASAIGLDKNEEKIQVQAFFTPDEIPAIGTITFEQLQLIRLLQRMQIETIRPDLETVSPELAIYYAPRRNNDFFGPRSY